MTNYNQPPRWNEHETRTASFERGWTGTATPQSPFEDQRMNVRTAYSATTQDERLAATFAHLSAAIAWIVSAGWLNFVGPLLVWLLYRDKSAFVRRAAAGSFNFTLGMTILGIVGWLMVFTIILAPIGAVLIAVSGIAAILLGCLGALRTWRGESFTYPWQFRVLS